MDFNFTEDQLKIRELAREVIETTLQGRKGTPDAAASRLKEVEKSPTR